jgi:signal recognition particle receptor subunit beta
MGFAIEQVTTARGSRAIVYDCGGAGRYRQSWDHFFGEVDGIVFVIDSSDGTRLPIVKELIEDLVQHPLVLKKPIVFLANKTDLEETAIPKDEIKRLIGLNKKNIANPFSVKPANGINGMGLNDAFSFIESHQIKRKRTTEEIALNKQTVSVST